MRLGIIALALSSAFGQNHRVFPLSQNETRQEMEEIATVLRGIADIQRVAIDDTKRTVTVEGTAGQIAMADWLFRQLDPSSNTSGVREYRPPATSDDVVRVFYVSHAATPRALQEIVTAVRSTADIPRMFVYSAPGAVVVRATNQQMSLAVWLMDQLNQPGNAAAPAPHEYRLSGDDVARVFELTYPRTPQQLQEVATLIRSIGDIPRLFIYSERRALAVRATAEQVGLAAWLVSELDKPAGGRPAAQDRGERHEYRLSSGPDNLVRVFYLAGDHQKAATQVRVNAGIPRLFVYNALGALAARGTVGQVATAERVLEEMKAQ